LKPRSRRLDSQSPLRFTGGPGLQQEREGADNRLPRLTTGDEILKTATLTVTPHVVSGTNKGGEDLFLCFECTEDASTHEVTPEDGNVSWDLEFDDEGEKVVKLSCITDHYEHEWEGTPDDLYALAATNGLLDKTKWQWYGPADQEPKQRWKHQHYVAGNAD